MRVVCVVAVLIGCGRVGFDDPRSETDAGDSALTDGDTCTRARRLTIGVARTNESIDGAQDDYASSACGGGADVVYSFQQQAFARRAIKLMTDFQGTTWYATTCPPVSTSCIGVGAGGDLNIESDFQAGTVYVVVEKVAGGGTTFSIVVD